MKRGKFLIFIFLFLNSCTSVFFFPVKEQINDPEKLGIDYKVITINDSSGPLLNAWLLPAKGETKGTILHLHGNAENISTHIGSVYWMPKYGYNVLMFDYRGFGASAGKPDLSGAIQDAFRVSDYLFNNPELNKKPIYLFGQSIGGAIGIYLASQQRGKFSAVVVESPFSSYSQIAKNKLQEFWLTYPFSFPLSLFFISKYDPIKNISYISPTPLLLVHSENDEVVPLNHSEDLYSKALPPKTFWKLTGFRHIQVFQKQENREKLIDFLNSVNH